jgi:hypothetical protein
MALFNGEISMNKNFAQVYFEYTNGSGKTITASVRYAEDDKLTSWDGILDEVARALEGFGFANIRSRLLITGPSIHAGKTLKEIYD